MYGRGFRGSRRRSSGRPISHTYKKVLNFIPASFGAGFTNQVLVNGKDNQTLNQTSNTDGNVPTGSIVKYLEIQFAVANLIEGACFINCSIQYKLDGQSFVDPDAMGGDASRNQCLHQELYSVGGFQNSTHKFKFKVPKRFQRVREGMQWSLTWSRSASVSAATQIIYKIHT